MTAPALLELRGVAKRFGPVQALAEAHLAVRAGEVHALLGENGAGKSTLMGVAAGLVRPDAGALLVAGRAQPLGDPVASRRAGIGLVHQHFSAVPALTVAENVALVAGWPVTPGPLRARVCELTTRLGLPLEPDARAADLPVGLRQRLEIVRALSAEARVLLLDEPTGVLAPAEAGELLARMRAFAEAGGAVVLITHKLDEALAHADRVTVLRRGAVTLEAAARDVDAGALAEAMLGTAYATTAAPRPAARPREALVRVRAAGLAVRREDGHLLALEDATLELRAGEIVAVAGVEGSGQRELLRAVAGLLPVAAGSLEVAGPVAFIAEDRTTEGLIPAFSLTENLVLGAGDDQPWRRGGRIDWRAARARCAALLEAFDVRAAGPDAAAATLSGGNQQKLVVARALERRPAVLVAENPARGLDLRAARAVHDRLRAAAAAGVAVLLTSSDLDEVLALGDRVAVAARGRVTLAPAGATREAVGALMLAAPAGARHA